MYSQAPIPIDWIGALGIAAIALAVGVALFAANIMGGGDIKLLVVCVLWVGWSAALLKYIIITSLIGGALSIALMIGRPAIGYLWLKHMKTANLPRIFEKGAPLPYGLAIAGAMIILIAQGKLTGLELGLN